jgi:Toprim domain-containing protein
VPPWVIPNRLEPIYRSEAFRWRWPQAAGVGYLEPILFEQLMTPRQRELLQRWAQRLVFPLTSLAGTGYVGRTLWGWKPGMHEQEHRALLDQVKKPRRWIKTNPAGWFGSSLDQLASHLILVEGAFDRLTLLTAGLNMRQVVALVGTTIQLDWFPQQVQSVMLALDTDEAGQEAARRLAERLAQTGVSVHVLPPLLDRFGKDWNERWRTLGLRSLWPLFTESPSLLPIA